MCSKGNNKRKGKQLRMSRCEQILVLGMLFITISDLNSILYSIHRFLQPVVLQMCGALQRLGRELHESPHGKGTMLGKSFFGRHFFTIRIKLQKRLWQNKGQVTQDFAYLGRVPIFSFLFFSPIIYIYRQIQPHTFPINSPSSPAPMSYVLWLYFIIICFHFQGKYCACPWKRTMGSLIALELRVGMSSSPCP